MPLEGGESFLAALHDALKERQAFRIEHRRGAREANVDVGSLLGVGH